MGLTMVIEQLGHHVCATAQTAGQAVDLAEASSPDVALVDVALADGTDGLAATREIAGRLGVPVIVCSAHASPTDAYAAGARHFLMKPFGIDALTEAMLSIGRSGEAEVVFAA
ncbi:response regulator [Skermanella pratensis]|uniref:response regulator n=1 Tax=Skermanella pratensis TaxID=2233999 RepID=UPI001788355B|nr:response regulator [Skermanella pratensis]